MARYTTTISKFIDLIVDIQDSDRDAVIVVSGKTGIGKSVLMWLIMRALAERRKFLFNPVRTLVYSREDFKEQLEQVPDGSGLAADEAVGIFYNRDYHDDEQIALLKDLDRMRDRHLVMLLLIPHSFHIDKHIRDARARYWIHIDMRYGQGKDGYAHCTILQPEENPFNPDPWNVNENKKLWRKGKIHLSINYVGEMIFKDIPVEEYALYKKIKHLKREIASSGEWSKAQKRKRRYGQTGETFDKRLNA